MRVEENIILPGEAISLIKENVSLIGKEEIHYENSLNRVIAEDIYAPFSFPEYKTSAMDGYAVRSEDTLSASEGNPIKLEVIEEIAAGVIPEKKIERFQCARIFTGAYLPESADSIIMQEYTKAQGSREVLIYKEVRKNENVREAGEDFIKDQLLISRGHKLTERDLMLLASIGMKKIQVYKLPLIGIITTGSELLSVEASKEEGKIRECNSIYLVERLKKLCCNYLYYGIVKDDIEELKRRIKQAIEECDVLITTGGISVGKYDLVKDALEDLGIEKIFWKLRIKPGKPLFFGRYNNKLIFGLPGNPGSAFITFEIFVRYALNLMRGCQEGLSYFYAYLDEDVKNKGDRTFYMRATLFIEEGKLKVKPSGAQGSAIISSIAKCNCISELPSSKEMFYKDELIKVYPIE